MLLKIAFLRMDRWPKRELNAGKHYAARWPKRELNAGKHYAARWPKRELNAGKHYAAGGRSAN